MTSWALLPGAIAALGAGLLYGFASVRGRFCMNSGFAGIVRGDYGKLKSYGLAILIQLALLPVLFGLSALFSRDFAQGVAALSLPPFYLYGTLAGGFAFGIAMRFAGGCPASLFYKSGAGESGALLALAGLATGIFVTTLPGAGPLLDLLRGPALDTGGFIGPWVGRGFAERAPGDLRFWIAPVAGVAAIFFWLRRDPDAVPAAARWGWKRTGLTVGAVGLLAWPAAVLAGSGHGMAIVPGVMDWLQWRFATWAALFIAAIPVGALLASRSDRSRVWPHVSWPPASQMLRRFAGGGALGASAMLAAGCTLGHGLTFLPLLSAGSGAAVAAMIAGRAFVEFVTAREGVKYAA